MGYALSVLSKLGATAGARRLRFVEAVACAFCGGRGEDPKYGTPGGCRVCGGAGVIRTVPPVVTCRVCAGSGCAGGDLPCPACKGVGVAPISPDGAICPRCGGRGEDGVFYCHYCKGQGLV
jgi:DnaJ-class molecular chaperone